MDYAETLQQVKAVNNRIKTLIDSFCNDLSTLTIENDSIVRECVNIEQIRQVLNELALIDADLIFDRKIIQEWKKDHVN